MTDGLWLGPNRFVEFGDMPRKEELIEEIASRQSAWDWTGMMGLLPDPDPILRKLGGGSEILESLTADGHLCSVIQSRKLGTLKKEWRFDPGTRGDAEATPQAEALCKQLCEDLERIDVYNLISTLLDAPLYGMTPIQLGWQPDGSRLKLNSLEAMPARWFGFDEQNRPKFISSNNPWDGEDLPYGKFVFSRHFPTYDNPYGLRLLSRCFWPVTFKKGGIKFWVTLAEKYGVPFLVGQYRSGADRTEQQTMLSNLVAMVRDAVAVIPQGGSVEILETGKSSAGAEIHIGLKEAMDAEMSKVIMGQTLTAEIGDSGSYAASKTHGEVLEDFRDSDQKLVKTAMNEIARIYMEVNAPGNEPPVFSWFEEDNPKKETAQRDKTLTETGITFTREYYQRTYNLGEDDFNLSGATATEQQPDRDKADFSEHQQDDIDPLIDDHLSDWQPVLQPVLHPLIAAIEGATDFDDLKKRLTEAATDQDNSALVQSLASATFKARGRGDAGDD